MASICRYVDSQGQVVFKRGLGKQQCSDISGGQGEFFEDPWKPHWFNLPFQPEENLFPINRNKEVTLELRDRENLRNNIWQQAGEEELLRQNAAFGANQGLMGDMSYAPQLEGFDFSPGTVWNQDMLDRTATNRAANVQANPNYTGFQDMDPSAMDMYYEMPLNRLGDRGSEIPVNEPQVSNEFQVPGDAQALQDLSRYNQVMAEAYSNEDWRNMPALSEQAAVYDTALQEAQPKTFTTTGYPARGADEFAEQPGERAAYLNEQARLAQQEQLLRDEKETIGLANYTPPIQEDVMQSNLNIFNDAKRRAEKEFNTGLPNYVPPVNEEQRKEDEILFQNARIQRNLEPLPDQPSKSDYIVKPELANTIGAKLVEEETIEKETGETKNQVTQERWYEGFKDETNPDSMKNQIYNSIMETGADKILDGIDDNSPQWLKDWAKGIVTDLQNKDYLKAGGKLWITKKGSTMAFNTAWKLLKPGKKFFSAGNVVKVAVGAEVYEMAVNPEDGPILQQIQDKVDQLMQGPVGSEVAKLVSAGDGTETNVNTTDQTTETTDATETQNLSTDADVLNSVANSGTMSNIQGNVGIDTTSSPSTNVFNAGESAPYSGNIGNMFTSLFNPSEADRDFWYKTREGDIPGNNRMREAMARLSYMGLYPEDRGTDPYQALTDDRVAYSNNLLDAQSSQSTLQATASNRQYNRWKDMLPSQSELAKQLVKDKRMFFGKSKESREAEAERAAGALLREFYGLMAKGVAPTPENLKVANELEKAGIDVNNANVQYAIENGLLEAMQDNKDNNIESSPSMLEQTTGFVNTVRNAFL